MSKQVKETVEAPKVIAWGYTLGGDIMGDPTHWVHKACRIGWRDRNKGLRPFSVAAFHPGAEKEQLKGKTCDHCKKPFKS